MMAKVLVETAVIYRGRYIVDTPDDHPEYALDTVTCHEADELSQQFLDEVIVSHRVIDNETSIKLHEERGIEDTPYDYPRPPKS